MDRLSAMRVFVRVAELSSFSAVAQQMGVARSVVTRQVAALEQHLGVKLMARSTRRLTLTSAGAAYLEKCRVILNLVEAAENRYRGAKANRARPYPDQPATRVRPQARTPSVTRFRTRLPGSLNRHGLHRPPGKFN